MTKSLSILRTEENSRTRVEGTYEIPTANTVKD